MNEKHQIRFSKFLSFLLRHHPETAGLELDPGGWVALEDLLAACSLKGWEVDRADLEELIVRSGKPRFSFSQDGTRFRANYGHSVAVDLELEPKKPPTRLYHGTAKRFMQSIKEQGLHRQGRRWVHLSSDRKTAIQVGQRHGSPVVLSVLAGRMEAGGFCFYQPAVGTWLTLRVPPGYIDFP